MRYNYYKKMKAYTKELLILKKELKLRGLSDLCQYYNSRLRTKLPPLHRPIRFVVTQTDVDSYHCELDLLVAEEQCTASVHVIGKTCQ